MKTLRHLLGIVSLLAFGTAAAATVEFGNPPSPGTGNCFPFTCTTSMRYQQVYAGNLFTDPFSITSVSFFNTAFEPGTARVSTSNFTIAFSTTALAPDALSPVFATNVGSDVAQFFSGLIPGAGAVFGTSFSIAGTPFTFDPSDGNLLMDVTVTGGSSGGGFLDCVGCSVVSGVGDESSRVFAQNALSGTGNIDSWALRTLFTGNVASASVPEPGTLALLGVALGALGLGRRRRKT